jgi:hypothetical protein
VATEADRVIAHIDAVQKGSEAGRYADLKKTMTDWSEAKDIARQQVILAAIAANTKAVSDLAAAIKAKGI